MNVKQLLSLVSTKNKQLILFFSVLVSISLILFYINKRDILVQKEIILEMTERYEDIKMLESLYNQIKMKKDNIAGLKLFHTNEPVDEGEGFSTFTISEIARYNKVNVEWVEQVPDKKCIDKETCVVISISLTGELQDFYSFLIHMISFPETEELRLVQIQTGIEEKEFMVHLKMLRKAVSLPFESVLP